MVSSIPPIWNRAPNYQYLNANFKTLNYKKWIMWLDICVFQDQIVIGLVFSVVFQETFRFLIYLLLRKADAYLKKLTENEETQIFANKHILAYVVGLGFGLMSGAFSLVNVLAASLGPGTLGFHGEPHNFFIVSAIMTLCMILLNTAWGVIFFASLDSRK